MTYQRHVAEQAIRAAEATDSPVARIPVDVLRTILEQSNVVRPPHRPQREQKAKILLRRKGFDAVVPTEVRFLRRTSRQRKAVERTYPLAVGYVLLKSPGLDVPWHQVFDAATKPYIKAIVGFGGRPAPIDDATVESFIAKSMESVPYQSSVNTRRASFRKGEPVHVARGPLRGLDATIEDITECRATIVLHMLGKSHTVALDLSNLRAA